MPSYASVIVDIQAEKLDRTFQYRIPKELEGKVCPGVRVVAPFGGGDRVLTGYVVETSDTPVFDPAKTRDILRIDAAGQEIEGQLVGLADWIRRNFGGTMNQALKTVIPVKEKKNARTRRTVCLAAENPEGCLSALKKSRKTAQERVFSALIDKHELPYETLLREYKASAALLRAMQEQGLILIREKKEARDPLASLRKAEMPPVRMLSDSQRAVAEDIAGRMRAKDLRPSLIHGVTGSGKTEIYMEIIAGVLARGKQAIVLIPEISLTRQTVLRFMSRFGDGVSILNSRMSQGERSDQMERARLGEICVMIGPRSALFTPFKNLGVIIIDEEHESSYKSETVPRYHARDVAIERAKRCGAAVVLGSATPSLESYSLALKGKYKLYELPGRVAGRPLPNVSIIDMRKEFIEGNKSILSRKLKDLIKGRLSRREQMMIFLNRRGMAGFVTCRSCGKTLKCPHCDVSMTLHSGGILKCHYCGHTERVRRFCPSCGSRAIGGFKAGTQKIEAILREEFPDARILRMDRDTTGKKEDYNRILGAFSRREADILVGTQMIVKGHDFPGVTLVAAIAADMSLNVPDFHAGERTYELLVQAAGRAGRGDSPGEMLIQTYEPDHYSICSAATQDFKAFYEREMAFREFMHYPPAWNMLVVHCRGEEKEKVSAGIELLKEKADAVSEETDVSGEGKMPGQGVQIIGPTDAPVAKINDIYRKLFYIKADDMAELIRIKDGLEKCIAKSAAFEGLNIQFDFNPSGI